MTRSEHGGSVYRHDPPIGDRCGSCGKPAEFTVTHAGKTVPACLRHYNHWRTPTPSEAT